VGDEDLNNAILKLTVTQERAIVAQEQTTKNLNELRREFKGLMNAVSKMSAIEEKLNAAHSRIRELKSDMEKDIDKLDNKFMKWMWTMLGLLGTGTLTALAIILNKG
jgi:predicted  nucleic acid-binding Zn-ribbon protein